MKQPQEYIKDQDSDRITIACTRKQAMVIRDACELYGRIQINQYEQLAEILCRCGWAGSHLQHISARKENETEEEYKEREKSIDSDNMLKAKMLAGMIKGFMDSAYDWMDKDHNLTPNEAQVALDVWAVLDGRREHDDFVMGSEPKIQVKKGDKNG